MNWLTLITLLALLQYFAFGVLVSRARIVQGIKAPAMTGDPAFERISRVHLNTLERLVLLLLMPLLWMAAQFWPATWAASAGALYLVGRMAYWRSYTRRPESRLVGTVLTMLPIAALAMATLVGLLRQWAA